MNESTLQIVITAVNNAAAAISDVQESLTGLSQGASEVATDVSNSLSAAEEAIVAQAQGAVDAWEATTQNIDASFEAVETPISEVMNALVSVNQEAAAAVATAWQEQSKAMEDDLAAALSEAEPAVVADATALGEAGGTAAGEGFGGYFKKMIIGYALDQIGSFLSGGIDSAVQAASKSANQIATITAQIEQQKAAIATNEAALQKWTGTTVQVNAAHEKAAANIQAEKEKITELNQQLATLQTQQQGLPGQIQSIENGMLGWVGANKQVEDSLQTFTTTLGPMLEFLGKAFIALTLFKVALSVLDTPMLILIGLALVVSGLIVIWQNFHSQITAFIDDLNAKTGIVDLFKQAWQTVSDNFNDNLKPALEQLWAALQPLEPYLKAMAVVIGVTLFAAVVLLTDALTIAINLFTDMLTAATKVATFFTNVFIGVLNSVEKAIEAIITAVSKIGSVGGAVGSVISNAMSSVLHVQDAIITPNGQVIQTDPADYLFATKTPGALAGGGGGGNVTVYVTGGTYLDQSGATMIANVLAQQIGRQIKLRNFF